jgi:hypothetical protein
MSEERERRAAPVFEQTYHQPQNVYNVAGDLLLPAEGKTPELVAALTLLSRELDHLRGLSPGQREPIAGALQAARAESESQVPVGSRVMQHLETARGLLEKCKGTAQGAVELGQTLGKIALWAAAFFA